MKRTTCSIAITACLMLGASAAQAEENRLSFSQTDASAEMVHPDANFYPLHCEWLQNKNIANEAISLGDRSQWRIDPETLPLINDWVMGDALVISPNYTPLSPYPYWIKNVRTEKAVLANIFLGAEEFGKNSHWIVFADQANQRLFLENRLGFEVDHRDKDLFAKWSMKDTVIIGRSNTWFTPFDYILINTARNQFIRAKLY